MSLPPINQVVFSFEIVGLMRGEEKANGGYEYHCHYCCHNLGSICLIPNCLCRPRKTEYYAYTRQTCTLCPDSSPCCHTRVYRTPLVKSHRRHQHLGILYILITVTLPCVSAMTLVQVRTSTSSSFGKKTASICQVMPHGLLFPTLVKSASIGGLKIAIEWSWT